jgi:lipopolysaccharide export system permease protein
MNQISRYILRQILGSMVFVTVALTCAIWLSQSLRLIDLIVNRGVSVTTFLYMSFLMLPTFLAIILPIALFTAVIFVYNKLTTDSELVVMRGAGLSQLNLAKAGLMLAAVVTLLCYGVTLYFLPASFRHFKDLQFKIRNDQSLVLLREGVFNTPSDGITVYVSARDASGELQGILIHDSRIPDNPVTMMAERGAMAQTESGPRVVMINGNRQEVAKETGRLSLLYFDRYTVDIGSDRKALQTRWREPRERFLGELFWPAGTPDDINNYYKLRAEGHQRLVAPLYPLSFTCIALAFLLSGQFVRRGQARRVLLGTLSMVVVQAAGLGLHYVTAKAPSLVPLIYVNAIVPILAGLFFLFQSGRQRAPLTSRVAVGTG